MTNEQLSAILEKVVNCKILTTLCLINAIRHYNEFTKPYNLERLNNKELLDKEADKIETYMK